MRKISRTRALHVYSKVYGATVFTPKEEYELQKELTEIYNASSIEKAAELLEHTFGYTEATSFLYDVWCLRKEMGLKETCTVCPTCHRPLEQK